VYHSTISEESNNGYNNSTCSWLDHSQQQHLINGSPGGTVLVPTRMKNGEIAFVLKSHHEQKQHLQQHGNSTGMMMMVSPSSTQSNYYYGSRGVGACCGDVIDTSFHKSFLGGGGDTFTGYTDNHLGIISNSRVWRPW
jgi:hypothetical protein